MPTSQARTSNVFLRAIAYFSRALVGAYALSTALHVLLHIVVGNTWAPVALFDSFAHWLWLPALPLLLALLFLRQWFLVVLCVPAVFAFMFHFGGQFVPHEIKAADDAPTFTLLSYNILATNRSHAATIEIIRAANADVVALQEVGQEANAALQAALGDLYPHQAVYAQANAFTGQALYSRFPVLASDYWQYDWLEFPLGHMRATLRVAGQPVALYNLHPVHPGIGSAFFDPRWRYQELQDIVRRIREEEMPVIATGDFNMPQLSPDYDLITQGLRDAHRDVGWGLGLTFPQWRLPALLRLDYAFYDPAAFVPLVARVLPEAGGSDHYPLLVRFALSDAQ